ncbi:hypothetical protein [Candidatus Chlamydia sanziniae]|uniref:Uncharacterized protein n=1 Tax=Candidatus Chlamydia sanziniae TaxID=1806891 RepID=A0A1A9HWZ9_9CHLA|nr:hypothetical protein [Candidatus Chlamydia sanziniae]ANH78622.1 hypothetical protein Cs308_0451 [Candidatus Chlamydia sanziniae]
MVDETPQENSSKTSSSQFESLKYKVKDLHTKPHVGRFKKFFSHRAYEVIGGCLVLIGIIADFVSWTGGLFVACGCVLGFHVEIRHMLAHLQSYYMKNGPLKNAILCGLLLFFLLNVFAFTLSFIILCVILIFLITPTVCSKGECDKHHDTMK